MPQEPTIVVPSVRFTNRTYTVFTFPIAYFDPTPLSDEAVLAYVAESVSNVCGLEHLTPCVRQIDVGQWMVVFWFGIREKTLQTYERDHPSTTKLVPCEKVVFVIDSRNGWLYLSDSTQKELRFKQSLCTVLRPLFPGVGRARLQCMFVPMQLSQGRISSVSEEVRQPGKHGRLGWERMELKGVGYETPGTQGIEDKMRFKGDGFLNDDEIRRVRWHHLRHLSLKIKPTGKQKELSISFVVQEHTVKVTLNGETLTLMANLLRLVVVETEAICA